MPLTKIDDDNDDDDNPGDAREVFFLCERISTTQRFISVLLCDSFISSDDNEVCHALHLYAFSAIYTAEGN